MAYATETYTGNGVTTNFALSWAYLDQAHVSATVDGSSVAFTWLNDSTITISPAPASGTTVRISRDTSRGTRLVDFTNGENLTEYILDLAMTQALYVAQEAFDASEAVENTAALQDMVDAAEAAKAAAVAAASNANLDATSASGSASSAAASAILADASADAAALSEAAAAGYATSALLKANNLSDLVSASAARTALGLGTAAVAATGDFATAAQGALADSALQPASLTTTEAATIVGDGHTSAFHTGKLLELKSSLANTDGARWIFGHVKNGADDYLGLGALSDDGSVYDPIIEFKRTGANYDSAVWYGTHTFATLGASALSADSFSLNSSGVSLEVGGGLSFLYDLDVAEVQQYGNTSVESLGTSITGTPTWDLGTANRYSGTLTGNTTPTLTAPDRPTTIRIKLTQDGTGGHTLTLPSSVKWPASYDATAKALSTAASAVDLLILDWDGSIYIANLLKGIA